jgi:large subunit ribosomal protein L25
MAETLNVVVREETGSSATKKLRSQGFIPANLYGHGQENANISIPADEWESAIRLGAKVVSLSGAVVDTALINEVQWDVFGILAIHVDLIRVSADERIETTVKVELRGDAVGAQSGGIVNHVLHEIAISCLAISVPDVVSYNVKDLELGGTVVASDLPLPEGTLLLTPPGDVVATCAEVIELDEESGIAGIGEPEVIGQKLDDEN